MDFQIILCDPTGPLWSASSKHSCGAYHEQSDIPCRCGLLIAALSAQGKSTIRISNRSTAVTSKLMNACVHWVRIFQVNQHETVRHRLYHSCYSFLTGCNNNKNCWWNNGTVLKVENLAPVDKRFLSSEDSLNATVKWKPLCKTSAGHSTMITVTNCVRRGITTAKGHYGSPITANNWFAPPKKNNINRYIINSSREQNWCSTHGSPIIHGF